MTTEDAYRKWAELESDERLEALQQAANEALESAGYDSVEVSEDGTLDNGMYTDPEIGGIHVSPSSLGNDDNYDTFQTLYHETWHSMDVQDGVYDRLSSDQQEAFNDVESRNGYFDEDGELREDARYVVPEHDNAEAYGNAMADGLRDAAEDDLDFDIDFANVTVTDAPASNPPGASTGAESASNNAFGFEIDWDHVIITSEDKGSDEGATEYHEGGHAVPSP